MTEESKSRLAAILEADKERAAKAKVDEAARQAQLQTEAQARNTRLQLWNNNAVPAIKRAVDEANILLRQNEKSSIVFVASDSMGPKSVNLTINTKGLFSSVIGQVSERDGKVFLELIFKGRTASVMGPENPQRGPYELEPFDAMAMVTDFVAASIEAETQIYKTV